MPLVIEPRLPHRMPAQSQVRYTQIRLQERNAILLFCRVMCRHVNCCPLAEGLSFDSSLQCQRTTTNLQIVRRDFT